MAAISSISNGEALSSVRTKLNSVITEINLLDPTDWVDYSNTSTIVGWSSFTTKVLKYRVVGKQVFVVFNLSGTSNSATTTFTIPHNTVSRAVSHNACVDNGADYIGLTTNIATSNLITFLRWTTVSPISIATWTSSGTKTIVGQFFYEIA